MGSVLIQNVDRIVTGDVDDPVAFDDSVYVEDGTIVEVGATTESADTVVDANGLVLTPGLIDAHVHPVLGGYTPRQRTVGWCESYLHCGITSMVSNGEPHVPGRPDDVAGRKALATLTRRAFENHRPGGAKVYGGTLLLDDRMTEADVEDVSRHGVERMKFLFAVEDRDRASDLVEWGHARDMTVMMHCGGTSLPGVESMGYGIFSEVGPDIAAHFNGGPTPIPDDEIYRMIEETDLALELVVAGNQRLAVEVLETVAERGELERLQVGTDTPSGTGVVPRGVLLQLTILAGMTDVPAAEVLCLATGNTARHHDLDEGFVEPGRPADLCLLGPPVGSAADDALEALELGVYATVDKVFVDGEAVVERSRNMPPSKASATIDA